MAPRLTRGQDTGVRGGTAGVPSGTRRRAPGASGGTTGARGGTGSTRLVGRPERRAGVALALVRPERHGALGLGGDGQRRVHAEVRRERRAVDHVQAGVPVEPLVRVDHPGLRGRADRAAADEVRGHRHVDTSPQVPPGSPSMISAIRRKVALAAGIHVGFGVPWPWREASRPSAPPDGDRVVERLHDQRDDRALRPVPLVQRAGERARVAERSRRASRSGRGTRPPPSVISVVSRPMALLP